VFLILIRIGSESALDPRLIRISMDLHSVGAWIRIHIPNADPDPEGVKRAKIKEKTKTKNRYIATKVPKTLF
jgi:hypothetical protein